MEILLRQRFFTSLSNAVETFWPHPLVAIGGDPAFNQCITTCDVIRVYCSILVNLIALKPNVIQDLSNNVLVEIIRLLPIVVQQQQPITRTSLLMLTEICNLTIGACAVDRSLLKQISVQERSVISALLNCLDVDIYVACDNMILVKFYESVLAVLNELCADSPGGGDAVVCILLADDEDVWNNVFVVVEMGIKTYKKNPGKHIVFLIFS